MEQRFKEELEFLYSVIRTVTALDIDLQEKMHKSLSLILEKIKAGKGSIMLLDKKRNVLDVVASTNKKILNKKIKIDPNTISGYVVTTCEPVYFKDVRRSKRFKKCIHAKNYSTPSLICIPLKGQEGVLGIITFSDHIENKFFTEQDFLVTKDYASIISPLLENSILFHKLREEKENLKRISEELRISKEELMMTYTERSELVEMVVHDFKSPLSAIISNLDLLKYIGGLTEQQETIVGTALNGAQKLLEMINEFLQIARVDQFQEGKIEYNPTSFRGVLDQVLEDLMPLAQEKSIDIKLLCDKDIILYGNHNLLVHLFQNLVSNAIKYTPKGGQVKIYGEVFKTKRFEDRFKRFAKICVEDTGPGIPDEHKSLIFNRFERLKRNKEVQGTGIGLFICKRIVNLLKGKIWVEDAPDTGSRFCFTCYVCEGNAKC